MKNLFLTLALIFATLLIGLSATAATVPNYMSSIRYTGIGTYNPPKTMKIYSEPDINSQLLETITWSNNGYITSDKRQNFKENEIFVVFLPSNDIAYVVVDDEQEGWVKIVYSQSTGKSGWVQTTTTNKFWTWLKFYMFWGKKNGIKLFKDIPESVKRLHSSPNDDAQNHTDFYYAKYIKLVILRGNWMLVKINDLGDDTKVGWIQWRTKEGKFMMFPAMR